MRKKARKRVQGLAFAYGSAWCLWEREAVEVQGLQGRGGARQGRVEACSGLARVGR